jgi:hypothetical protein
MDLPKRWEVSPTGKARRAGILKGITPSRRERKTLRLPRFIVS